MLLQGTHLISGDVDVHNDNPHIAQASETRRWVWACSEDSIDAGKISIFAVAEVLAAIPLYWWLFTHIDRLWMAFVGLFAAPMLLLRSPASIDRGVTMLSRYWTGNTRRASRWEIILIYLISVLSAAVIVGSLFNSWLLSHTGWSLFWRASVMGAVAGFVTGAFMSALKSVVPMAAILENAYGVFITGATLGAIAGMLGVAMAEAAAIVGVVLGAILVAVIFALPTIGVGAVAVSRAGTRAGTRAVGTLAPAVLGMLLRSVFIRWFATLRHLPTGLANLPQNWRETLLVIDPFHPPELLPKAGEVNAEFTVRGVWRSALSRSSANRELLLPLLTCVAWYLPAMAYRWSLKANAWLWWPLALALSSPLRGLDSQTSRERTARSVSGAWPWVALLVLVVVFLWLVLAAFPDGATVPQHIWPKEASAAETLLSKIAPPPVGVRYVIVWLVLILGLILWWRTKDLKATHGKVLESPKEFNDLDADAKARFMRLARPIEKVRLLLIVCLVMLCEAYALIVLHAVDTQLAEKIFGSQVFLIL